LSRGARASSSARRLLPDAFYPTPSARRLLPDAFCPTPSARPSPVTYSPP